MADALRAALEKQLRWIREALRPFFLTLPNNTPGLASLAQVEQAIVDALGTPSAPRRRWELSIRLGADDWDYLARQLVELARHIEQHGPACSSVSGGYSGNHIVELAEHPDMTHDRYFEELEAHLAKQRGNAAAEVASSNG